MRTAMLLSPMQLRRGCRVQPQAVRAAVVLPSRRIPLQPQRVQRVQLLRTAPHRRFSRQHVVASAVLAEPARVLPPAQELAVPASSTFDPLRPSFIWAHLRSEWVCVCAALVALLGCTVLCVSAPLFSSRFFESLIGNAPEEAAVQSVLCLLGVYILEPLFTLVYVRSIFHICESAFERIRCETFRAVLIQRVDFFDQHKTAELAALLSGELGSLRSVLADNVSRDRGLRAACEALATAIALACLSLHLAPVLGLLTISVAVSAALFTRKSVMAFGADVAVQAKLTEAATSAFGAIRTVRSFGGEGAALRRYSAAAGAARTSGLGLGRVKSGLECVNRGAIYASLFMLYAYGGYLVRADIVPVGTILASIGYTFILIFGCQGCVNTFLDVARARGALDRIRALIASGSPEPSFLAAYPEGSSSITPLSPAAAAAAARPAAAAARVGVSAAELAEVRAAAASQQLELRGVGFRYPGRPDAPVLSGLSITFPRGKVTALVGRSGAGKSTVAQLLARFYEPQEGALLLGGEPVGRFSAAAWSAAHAYVPQEPVLFAGSIAYNIGYGAPAATREDIRAAAAAAEALGFIEALPAGFDTEVGERGASLSGGQKQRIAIARAILKDSPVLILDEATSALDAVSEQAVQAALQRLSVGRTVVVIAHRLSTVQSADQIVVLAAGAVEEVGTHDQLLAKGGFYRQLVAGAGADVCVSLLPA